MRNTDKKEINIIVGENIRKYRDIVGYSRERFAELIGVTPRFIADVETGFVGVSLTTLKKICEVLGISADRILWTYENELNLNEKISHLEPKYIPLVEDIVQKQLEVIAFASKEEKQKKTRR